MTSRTLLVAVRRTHSFPEFRRALLNSRWAQKFPLRRGWISHILNGKGGAVGTEYEPIFRAQKWGPESGPPSENNRKQYEIDSVREAQWAHFPASTRKRGGLSSAGRVGPAVCRSFVFYPGAGSFGTSGLFHIRTCFR